MIAFRMSAKRKATVSAELSEILHDFLALATIPVSASGLQNALAQLRGELEPLSQLDADDLLEMLEGLARDGRLLHGGDGRWSLAAPPAGDVLRQMLARPGWEQAAAVISRVGKLRYKDEVFTVGGDEAGEVSLKIYDTITGIQYGRLPDPFGWRVEI